MTNDYKIHEGFNLWITTWGQYYNNKMCKYVNPITINSLQAIIEIYKVTYKNNSRNFPTFIAIQ